MTRENNLAKNTVLLFIGKICTQCLSFFLLPLYTSILSTKEYGIADLIITYVSLLYPIFGMQLEQGLFRMLLDYRDNKNNTTSLFSTVVISNIVQIFIFAIICFPICFIIKNDYIIYLLPLVIVQIIQGTLLQFARGIDKTVIYTISGLINAILHIGFNIVFIAIFKIGLTGLFYSIIIAGIGSSFFIIFSLRLWNYIDIKRFRINEFISICKYSIPLIPNQLAWWIVNVSDRTVITFFLGTGANGVYSVANKFSSVYITFYNYFNMSWTESVSLSINDSDKNDYINKMINIFFNLIITICLGIIACMPFVYPVLVSNPEYKGAYYQIPILMIAVFFQALQGLYSAVYVALKKTKEIAKTSIVSAIINISVNLMLVKLIGLYAASVSTLVAFLSMAIYRYVDIKKYVDLKIKKRYVLYAILIGISSCIAYYSENMIICGIALGIVIMYSIIINKGFIIKVINVIKCKITSYRRSN